MLITGGDELLTFLEAHKLYSDWDARSIEQFFMDCDELLAKSPEEFKRILSAKKFPGSLFAEYLKEDYHRELEIEKMDPRLLLINLVSAFNSNSQPRIFLKEQTSIYLLNKIAMKFETLAPDLLNFVDLKVALISFINELIKVYTNNSGWVATHQKHYYKTIINLIKLTGDLNIADELGNTPLHAAIPNRYKYYYNNSHQIIKYLLTAKASVKIKNNTGDTPLSLLARYFKSDATPVALMMLDSPTIDIKTIEDALCVIVRNYGNSEPLHNYNLCTLLVDKLKSFPEWNPADFFENTNVFMLNNVEKIEANYARQNIMLITGAIGTIKYLNVPLNEILETKITIANPDAAAIVASLLGNHYACELAKYSSTNNIFVFLQQRPEICAYLNQNIHEVMRTLRCRTTALPEEVSKSFIRSCATASDILQICRFDNNSNIEYMLFTLRILVEQVFSTQFIPVRMVSWLPSDVTVVFEEQVKQQLKSAVFSLIEKNVNIEPIKEYLRSRDSGLNKIFFKSFVHNFLSEIEERELTPSNVSPSHARDDLPQRLNRPSLRHL